MLCSRKLYFPIHYSSLRSSPFQNDLSTLSSPKTAERILVTHRDVKNGLRAEQR